MNPAAPRKDKDASRKKVKFLVRSAKKVRRRVKTAAAWVKDKEQCDKQELIVTETCTQQSTIDEDDNPTGGNELAAPESDDLCNMFTPIVPRKRSRRVEGEGLVGETISVPAFGSKAVCLTPKRYHESPVPREATHEGIEVTNGENMVQKDTSVNGEIHATLQSTSNISYNEIKENNNTQVRHMHFQEDEQTNDEEREDLDILEDLRDEEEKDNRTMALVSDDSPTYQNCDCQLYQAEMAMAEHEFSKDKPISYSSPNYTSIVNEKKRLLPKRKENAMISGSYTLYVDHRNTTYGHIQNERMYNAARSHHDYEYEEEASLGSLVTKASTQSCEISSPIKAHISQQITTDSEETLPTQAMTFSRSCTFSPTGNSGAERCESDNGSDCASTSATVVGLSDEANDATLVRFGSGAMSRIAEAVKSKLKDCVAPQHHSPSPTKVTKAKTISVRGQLCCMAPELQSPLSYQARVVATKKYRESMLEEC